jgi:cell division septum initiation protein DivIVA
MLQANNNLQRVQSVKPDIDQLIDQLSTQRTGLDASGSDLKAQIEDLRQKISLARDVANRLGLYVLCIRCKKAISVGAKTLFTDFAS